MKKILKVMPVVVGLAAAGDPAAVLAQEADPAPKERPMAPEEIAIDIIKKSTTTVQALKERQRFTQLLREARGAMIVPEVLKAGFIVGGKGGRGVVMARTEDGGWSYPAFYRIHAASVGLQFGVEVAQIALLIMSDKALDAVLAGDVELGAGVSVAVGPLGGAGEISTQSDVFTFSINKGAFAGVSFEGAVISTNEARNEVFYGQAATAEDIVKKGLFKNPAADGLRAALASK